ncbi:FadR/GntR family transcriptional regulator [Leifsonia sp. NPDC077715]|uniref:FadR/GntR family transcriptional regulator n=1 Tax=Leifsonia sp. NPDC077715 TaxID=3155539 RepID=UPI00343CA712
MSDTTSLVTSRGRPLRLSQSVATELIRQVVSGELEPGSALPGELALCDAFEVSRPVIREAVKVLEQKGLVRVRQGDGTTIRPRSEWNLLDPAILPLLLEQDTEKELKQDVIALRRDLEADMVRRAVARLTEADFAEMSGYLRIMDSEADPLALRRADSAFHAVIHRASGNEIARTIVTLLVSEAREVSFLGTVSQRHYRDSNAQHRRIHELLLTGDSEAAAECMAEHVSTQWLIRRDPA